MSPTTCKVAQRSQNTRHGENSLSLPEPKKMRAELPRRQTIQTEQPTHKFNLKNLV